jgi:hypothetical protein
VLYRDAPRVVQAVDGSDHRQQLLARRYMGETLQVRVLAGGFEFEGAAYPSLSAIARAITGSHCNCFLFFRLAGKGGDR